MRYALDVVRAEVYSLVQSIRKHSSFGVRFFSDESQNHVLLEAFQTLQEQIFEACISPEVDISLDEIMEPFLLIVRSEHVSGTVMGMCFGSLSKFMRSHLFEHFSEEQSSRAIRRLVSTIGACRLESSDIIGDEMALHRLLDVLQQLVMRDCFFREQSQLTDGHVCLIVEVVFAVMVLPRMGELFRRNAELTCISICSLFMDRALLSSAKDDLEGPFPQRLPSPIAYPGHERTALELDALHQGGSMGPLEDVIDHLQIAETDQSVVLADEQSLQLLSSSGSEHFDASLKQKTDSVSTKDCRIPQSASRDSLLMSNAFGLPALKEIFSFLLRLLSTDDLRNTDRLRSLALVIISDFLERHEQEELAQIWQPILDDQFARVLIQLLLMESPVLMTHLQQAIYSFYCRSRPLIAQTEMLIVAIMSLLSHKHSLIGSSSSVKSSATSSISSLETASKDSSAPMANVRKSKIPREYYWDLLVNFISKPKDLLDLFVNCECSSQFSFVVSNLVNLLMETVTEYQNRKAVSTSAAAGSSSSTLSERQVEAVYCLRLLDHFVRAMMQLPLLNVDFIESMETLQECRRRKVLLHQSAEIFNRGKSKDAFAFLKEHSLVDDLNPKTMAEYLRRNSSLLDRRSVGELLARTSNEAILVEFMNDFDLKSLGLVDALRFVLESFHLPGEGQQIDRILIAFAAAYYKSRCVSSSSIVSADTDGQSSIFANADAIYVLSYSIVMLNTDLHSRHLKDANRMSFKDFVRNNSKINDGQDFEESFLRNVYDSIKEKEFVMPWDEQRAGKSSGVVQVTDFMWHEQMNRRQQSTLLKANDGPSMVTLRENDSVKLVGTFMVELYGSMVLDLFKRVILQPVSDAASQLAVSVFSNLGSMADIYGSYELFTKLVGVLCECLSFEDIASGGEKSSVDGLAVTFNQIPRYIVGSELFRQMVQCFFDLYRLHNGAIGSDDQGWALFVLHMVHLMHAGVVSIQDTFSTVIPNASNRSKTTGPDHGYLGPEYLMNMVSVQSPSWTGTAASPGNSKTPTSGFGIFSTLKGYLTSSSPAMGSNVGASSPASNLYVHGYGGHVGVDEELRSLASKFVSKHCHLDDILVKASKSLSDRLLKGLVQALCDELVVSKPPVWSTLALVCLADVIVIVSWNNRDRMSVFWEIVYQRLADVACDVAVPSLLQEHVILGMGHLSLRIADRTDSELAITKFFQLLCHVPSECFAKLAEPALATVVRIMEMDPPFLCKRRRGAAVMGGKDDERGEFDGEGAEELSLGTIWPHYFSVLALAGRSKSCGPFSFALLSTIVRDVENGGILFPIEFFGEYVDILSQFISSASSFTSVVKDEEDGVNEQGLELAQRALMKFGTLEANVRPEVLASRDGWTNLVLPIHEALAQQCLHGVREVRQHAMGILQKLLQAVSFVGANPKDVGLFCFASELRSILFSMMEQLQSQTDASEIVLVDEVQMRVASFVARFYLSNLSSGLFASFESEMTELWLELLQHMLKFVTMPTSTDLLREGIPETIKNMLFVMAGVHSIDGGDDGLWSSTWKIVDPILPRMRSDIDALLGRSHSDLVDENDAEPDSENVSEQVGSAHLNQEREASVDVQEVEEAMMTEAIYMEQQRSEVIDI